MNKKEIGDLLKRFRKTNHYSVEEIITLLEERDIYIASKTYYGYESGTNKPNLDVFLALCNIYQYDILELICEFPSLRSHETQMIRNYQALDANGKSAVNALIKYELERTNAMKYWREKAELSQKQLSKIKKTP